MLSRPQAFFLHIAPAPPPGFEVDHGRYRWLTKYGCTTNSSYNLDTQCPTSALMCEDSGLYDIRLYMVPALEIPQIINLWCDAPTSQALRGAAIDFVHERLSSHRCSIVDVLRQMYSRKASRTEDLVYGCLGLLNIRLSQTPYGVGVRTALKLLVDSLHLDQRLLICAVEAYHGDPSSIDGFSTIPAWKDPYTQCAPRLKIGRTLGLANFLGHQGMEIYCPCVQGRLSRDHSKPRAIDSIGLPTHMFLSTFHREHNENEDHDVSQSAVFVLTSFGDQGPSIHVNLTAIATCEFHISTPASMLSAERDDVLFLCMVCTRHGDVLRKNGLAVIRAASHSWEMSHYTVG